MPLELSWKNNNLKELIKKKGYTQAEFTELLGITQGSLNHYMNSIRQPNLDMICKMCNLLNIDNIENLFK